MHFEEARVLTTKEEVARVLAEYSPAKNTDVRKNEILSDHQDPEKWLPVSMVRRIEESDEGNIKVTVYLVSLNTMIRSTELMANWKVQELTQNAS